MADWRQCIPAITAAAGREMSREEVEALADAVAGRMRRKMQQGLSKFDASDEVGREMGGEAALAAMLRKREAHLKLRAEQGLAERTIAGQEARMPYAVLSGDMRSGARDAASSTWAIRGANRSRILGPMVEALDKAGLLRVLRRIDPAFEKDLSQELERLQDPEGKIAATGNAHAEQAAKILGTAQEAGRAMLNSAGAWIAKIDNYVTQQAHDMMKVRNAGLEAWKNEIRPKLDPRTFDDVADPEKYLDQVWQALATGVHDNPPRIGDAAAFSGPGNVAKKLSQGRSLIFKPGEWFGYNQKFGKGGVLDSIIAGVDKASRDAAMMTTFGTNPEANFTAWVGRMQKAAYDRGDFKTGDKLKLATWKPLYDQASGAAGQVVNPSIAQVGAFMRNFQQVTKLGSVWFSSLVDVAHVAALLRHNGMGLFEGYANALKSILPEFVGVRTADRLDALHAVGATIDSMIGHAVHRFRAEDDLPGMMSNFVNQFHKYNGLEYWTDAMKGGLADGISHVYGRAAGRTFDQLAPLAQTTLRRYGIESAEWDTIRQHAAKADDGRTYLMPNGIEDPELSLKFQTLISDQVQRGLHEPSPYAKTWATAGTNAKAGTVGGEALKTLFQFKNFGVSILENQTGALFRGGKADIPGMIHLAIATTILGYLGNSLSTWISGRTMASPKDATGYASEIAAAFKRGGAAGLLGDFTLNQGIKQSLGDFLLGPTGSTINKIYGLAQDVANAPAQGKSRVGKLESEGIPLLRQMIPGNNLPGMTAAVNYALLYGLMDRVNPGYVDRLKSRTRQAGQTYWLSPPSHNSGLYGLGSP